MSVCAVMAVALSAYFLFIIRWSFTAWSQRGDGLQFERMFIVAKLLTAKQL